MSRRKAKLEAEEFNQEEVTPHEQLQEPDPNREMDFSLVLDLDASSLEKKINDMSHHALMRAFDISARIRKGKPVSDSEKIAQEEEQKQLKIIIDIHTRLKKSGIISSQASAEAFDKSLMEKIKSKSGTMGDIVVTDTRKDGKS
jgi:hypothetical protein